MRLRLCAAQIRSWQTNLNGARRFATEHGVRAAIYCRITGASNGIYPANAHWFTWAISDEQDVKPLAEVGKHWTCVQMVRPQ